MVPKVVGSIPISRPKQSVPQQRDFLFDTMYAMKLLILFGAPSVGKATVGRLVEEKTNFKLFHNHMIMDGVIHIFGMATASEDKLSKVIRHKVIEEAAESGINLIFTYAWNFGNEKGKSNIDSFKRLYEERGGKVIFVELTAPVDVRLQRASHPERKRLKAHAPDAERVAHLETILDFESPSPFYYPESYHRIDTTSKTAAETAAEIISLLHD